MFSSGKGLDKASLKNCIVFDKSKKHHSFSSVHCQVVTQPVLTSAATRGANSYSPP